jgi:hypothetical protein
MGARALVPDRHFLLRRRQANRRGHHETVVYTGSLRQKPTGWAVVKEV